MYNYDPSICLTQILFFVLLMIKDVNFPTFLSQNVWSTTVLTVKRNVMFVKNVMLASSYSTKEQSVEVRIAPLLK